MNKRKQGRKFGREAGPRKAFLSAIARALVQHERIKTTEARAKEISPVVEKLITKAKRGDLAARRELLRHGDNIMAKKILEEIAPRYKDRSGGYTRIVKIGARKSDGARMAFIEFV